MPKIHSFYIIRGTFCVAIIFLFSAVFIWVKFSKSSDIRQIEHINPLPKDKIGLENSKMSKNDPKLSLVIITSNSSLYRIPLLMKTWGDALLQTRFSNGKVHFAYIEGEHTQKYKYPTLKRSQRFSEIFNALKGDMKTELALKNLDLCIKEISILDYFVNEDDAEWLLRAVDDSFLNMNEFPSFYTSLPDPTKNDYIFGSCVDSDISPFLHGGCGLMISRGAAEKLLKNGEEWIKGASDVPEEIYYTKLIESAGLNVLESASPSFFGTFIQKDDIETEKTEVCPEFKNVTKLCPRYLQPIKKTVFFHDKYHKMTMEDWESLVDDSSDKLHWYGSDAKYHLCSRS